MPHALDLSRIDLNLLVLFEVVREERHVGRAAARLHLSPSAVSHGLTRLRSLLEDPLFLRTPKGVVPTARADELALPVAEILTRVRQVVASATPFDPATSTRRFTIGAPDGNAAVILPALLASLREEAPLIDIGIRHLLPIGGLEVLETREVDVAVTAAEPRDLPARFDHRLLQDETFVIAARRGHPFLARPTLEHYCALGHVLVSARGDARGFVDDFLAARGRTRRVALVVPHFLLALAALVETELIAAVPRSFAEKYAPRFGIESVAPPLPLVGSSLLLVTLKSAAADAGLQWLVAQLLRATEASRRTPKRRAPAPRKRTR